MEQVGRVLLAMCQLANSFQRTLVTVMDAKKRIQLIYGDDNSGTDRLCPMSPWKSRQIPPPRAHLGFALSASACPDRSSRPGHVTDPRNHGHIFSSSPCFRAERERERERPVQQAAAHVAAAPPDPPPSPTDQLTQVATSRRCPDLFLSSSPIKSEWPAAAAAAAAHMSKSARSANQLARCSASEWWTHGQRRRLLVAQNRCAACSCFCWSHLGQAVIPSFLPNNLLHLLWGHMPWLATATC